MADVRPDPDQLLARVTQEARQAQRGKLKIYFGASAGVGKTYAMLTAARAARQQGVDVVCGVIETHGRAETEALASGIETLPLRAVTYRDRTLREFDLDAVLQRRPQLVLVDELAHSNVPGSRHPKRWQDIEELLAAGITVWSTMNVQHLDSLNDIVSGITGIRVRETVPDRVFDAADEVVIVDLPPDDLLQRLKDGKVYLAHQAERAVRNFFRKGNLIALRELALRRTADRVDDDMLKYRRELSGAPVWHTREALLVGIGTGPGAEKLVRSGARLAAQLDVPWHCIHVETPARRPPSEADRQKLFSLLKLAQDSGAVTATPTGDRLADALVRYAHEHNLSRIVLGRDGGRAWRPWRVALASTVGRIGPNLDVVQIAVSPLDSAATPTRPHARTSVPADPAASVHPWRPYLAALALCAAVTALAAPLYAWLDLTNIVMLFLLAVVAVALRLGRGPAVLAAFVSVGAFDFFYVPPRFSFSVSDAQYLLTFAVMLAVALVIGQLTAGLKFQVGVASRRGDRVSALYRMSRDLSGALMPEQVAEIAARFAQSEFDARIALLVADAEDRLSLPASVADLPGHIDIGIAQWAFDHGETAGHGTDTLPGSPILYLPLRAPMRLRGVLAIESTRPARLLDPEQRRLLDTGTSLLAQSLERIHYVEVAQSTTLQMESERLRNSLLSAISHDLRTPLTALVGMSESLAMTRPPPTAAQLEIVGAMGEAAQRMRSLVNNLLDMARLESGQVRLNLQWQPIEEVIGSAIKALDGTLGTRPIRVKLPPDLPLLHIDSVLFERVFCNLFENAAKYTPDNSPIDVGAQVLVDSVRLTVDDQGPGLPKGREEAIFQKFERGRKESATAGVGLGLTICRAIVQAHGGTISGETRPQGGARFTMVLPRGEPPRIDADDESEEVSP